MTIMKRIISQMNRLTPTSKLVSCRGRVNVLATEPK